MKRYMLVLIAFFLATPLAEAMAQIHCYAAYGRLKCADGSFSIEGGPKIDNLPCDDLYGLLFEELRADTSIPDPPCENGGELIEIEDGCFLYPCFSYSTPTLAMPNPGIDPTKWYVELIYTFADGVPRGVRRSGNSYCEAFLAAQERMCQKQVKHGQICRGTGMNTVRRPYSDVEEKWCAPCCLNCCPPAAVPNCSMSSCCPSNAAPVARRCVTPGSIHHRRVIGGRLFSR